MKPDGSTQLNAAQRHDNTERYVDEPHSETELNQAQRSDDT